MRKKLLLSVLMATMSLTMFAQGQPTHPLYVAFGNETALDSYFDAWEPGSPLKGSIDDNFFISRVKPKARFTNAQTQVNPSLTVDRKLMWWCPIGESSKVWGALPRYNFEADNFNMWQYLDFHGNWSGRWFRVPGAFSDVAHKNGVQVGCTFFIEWAASVNTSTKDGKVIAKLTAKNADGTFKNSTKLVKILKYYGIDGIGVNPEGNWTSSLAIGFQDFVADCNEKAVLEGWHFRVDWYDSNSNTGSLGFRSNQLDATNKNWFVNPRKDNKPVMGMFMLNYNWDGNQLPTSAANAVAYGRSSYDVYAGFDSQGRGWTSGGGAAAGWDILKNQPISICIWGNHAKNMVYQNSGENGSSDLAIQQTYLTKSEQIFTGGTRNPANTPEITNTVKGGSSVELKAFHGFSKLIPARSTLQEIPFVTKFNLGNGQFFNEKGITTFPKKWYNIGMQDYLPTWRWWVVDATGNVPADPIKCDFVFEDAWFGGSCLKIHGATTRSDIRLFKTKFAVQPTFDFSLTYKVKGGVESKMKLIYSKVGSESEYQSVIIPNASSEGVWKTSNIKLSDMGIVAGDVIACIGLSVENTSADYEVLLGELSIKDPAKTYNPATPVITYSEVLAGTYNTVDFKLVFKSKDPVVGDESQPIYNEDVDTWYFEIFSQQDGSEPVLVTATTSWAAYVVGAPAKANDMNSQFGVRAVAPDGVTKSPIVWTEAKPRIITPVETVLINKPIIKANEEFSISFEDPLHVAATWEILDVLTGNVVYTKADVTSFSTSLPDESSYDLRVKYGSVVSTIRGFIQISRPETGALPTITSLTANKVNPVVDAPVEFSYISKDGEGNVSKSLRVSDPYAFKVPYSVQTTYPYSYSLWFKPAKFSHLNQGTNLLQKRWTNDRWPDNNWGDIWVQIRSGEKAVDGFNGQCLDGLANEISFNTYGWKKHDCPNMDMISTGYPVTEGTWTHLVITADIDKTQRIYINGKKVAEQVVSAANIEWNKHLGQWDGSCDTDIAGRFANGVRVNSPIYIGGPGVYKAGFDGWIDEFQVWNKVITDQEVLESMKGYQNAPEGLVGYWDFENMNTDYSFNNRGTMGPDLKGELIAFVGGAGESTGGQIDERQPTQTELGNPAIIGSMEVKTSPIWNLEGATMTAQSDKNANAAYNKEGKYTVELTLVNMWGKANSKKIEYIVVSPNTGVSENSSTEYHVYPNPFIDVVYVQFTEMGLYTIQIFNNLGQLVAQNNHDAVSSELMKIDVKGEKGIYYAHIMKDGKTLKTVKIIKE